MAKDVSRMEEQARVDFVIEVIKKRISALQERVGDLKSEIVEIRKNFWDDVTVNSEDLYEMAETYASMRQQAEILTEREVTHRHDFTQLKALKKLESSPYFGRIDFLEDEAKKADQIYLGIASLMDDEGENFLIYDWRAPVSSLYYDYPPGPAQYKTPGGMITGTMELKRQFIIRDGQMISMFDTGVTIGDEMLQEVLGNKADSQMKSIVATIQREQNRIIRNERSSVLIVQGAAGSGKTSAALQRVAYLLYRYRETLKAEQIVLFSPNPMFNSYVSTVLPELGEENMQQTTFQEYLTHLLGKSFKLEDPFTQMEYTLTAVHKKGYQERIEGINYKASKEFLHVIDEYAEHLKQDGMIFKNLKLRGKVLISSKEIWDQFYSYDSYLSIPNRLKFLSEWLLKQLKEFARKERNEPWVEEAIELLDEETYIRAHQNLQKKRRYSEDTFDDSDRERELLSIIVVQKFIRPLRRMVKGMGFVDTKKIYRQFFAQIRNLTPNWSVICGQTIEKLDRSELAYEDATPYLYLNEKIVGFHTNNSIRHVFIDEAQDYSPFQFEFLRRLFPRGKMTILGDVNQAIFSHSAGNKTLIDQDELHNQEHTEVIVLKRSYRSTRQIVDFTRGFIPGGEEIEPFQRDGKKPTITQVKDDQERIGEIIHQIKKLQASGSQSIAIIGKSAMESKAVYEALQPFISLRLVSKETISFEKGTLVIPSYLAKGVEFDGVIIFDASCETYCKESERKLFYTACTRAMHELHLYAKGELSPFIYESESTTYVRD
ncbi:MAG TPA: helicase [Paenibacillaceae bacterium]|nr:helicase [Paenibacillaceae bacterium]